MREDEWRGNGARQRLGGKAYRRGRRRLVGWDAAWAARFRRWVDALGKLAVRCLSRLVNLVRLSQLPGHMRNVRRSRRVLRTVRGFKEPDSHARSLAYLRAVDPLLFEEVVMSALEDAGLMVLRGTRYSGDGGIDGAVWLPKRGWYAVQCKRYRGHIWPAHVWTFGAAVARGKYDGGLLVHTGRSGTGLYPQLDACHIGLLSGERLLLLMLCRVLEYRVCGEDFNGLCK